MNTGQAERKAKAKYLFQRFAHYFVTGTFNIAPDILEVCRQLGIQVADTDKMLEQLNISHVRGVSLWQGGRPVVHSNPLLSFQPFFQQLVLSHELFHVLSWATHDPEHSLAPESPAERNADHFAVCLQSPCRRLLQMLAVNPLDYVSHSISIPLDAVLIHYFRHLSNPAIVLKILDTGEVITAYSNIASGPPDDPFSGSRSLSVSLEDFMRGRVAGNWDSGPELIPHVAVTRDSTLVSMVPGVLADAVLCKLLQAKAEPALEAGFRRFGSVDATFLGPCFYYVFPYPPSLLPMLTPMALTSYLFVADPRRDLISSWVRRRTPLILPSHVSEVDRRLFFPVPIYHERLEQLLDLVGHLGVTWNFGSSGRMIDFTSATGDELGGLRFDFGDAETSPTEGQGSH